MNVLLSTVGRRSYLVDYFKSAVKPHDGLVIGTSDRHDAQRTYTPGLVNCDRAVLVPSILTESYIDAVLEVIHAHGVRLITSLFDLDSYTLSPHLDHLRAAGAYPVISSRAVNEICFDKLAMNDFLAAHGFASVETWSTIEACLADHPQFPLFVKPRRGYGSLSALRVESIEQLLACRDGPEPLIVQRCLDYPEYGFDAFCDEAGTAVSCVIRRKIAMRAGETDQAVTVVDDDLLEFALALTEALAPTGPLDVDFFLTREGPVVVDMNPRLGGGYPLAHAAGAGFPELMVDMALGRRLQGRVGNYEEGLVMLKDVRPLIRATGALTSFRNASPGSR